jgi:hypothetical protein
MLMRFTLFASAFLVSGVMVQAQIGLPVPNASLCNSGRTPKGLPPGGCLKTVLEAPLNPLTGGSTIDGNWELAAPYPSKPNTELAPDPCTLLTSWGPAWVDTPLVYWYNPNDGLSQWITPFNEEYALPGWYVYRTGFTVPAAQVGYPGYLLEVTGQLMADNQAVSIYVLDAKGVSTTCQVAGALTNQNQFYGWTIFHFAAQVTPATHGYLYFVVQNATGAPPDPAGLRVEFATPYYIPD